MTNTEKVDFTAMVTCAAGMPSHALCRFSETGTLLNLKQTRAVLQSFQSQTLELSVCC